MTKHLALKIDVDTYRGVRDAGFETGIHCYDHIRWQDYVAGKDNEWTEREMQRAVDRYTEIFGVAPKAHAAAGWQMNRHAMRLTQRLGFDYSSDSRGTHPYTPAWNAEIIACPQLPTTLPTLDELLNSDNTTPENAAQHLLHLTESSPATGHVFTLHAELEGGKFLPLFETMLTGWKAQGYELVSLRQIFQGQKEMPPNHEVMMREVAGRTGTLATQG